ncbi:winged helix DNA-binding domain-containing protein [Guyanagaster necrorhizus]|uniref:Winged helix DNA-binding domain-containing protein n=1 Tax=Guyanagaster necrorhizus TaxID=856835 RepID=A0A9P7VNL3_9AGAR|nr:winged helix DNA-binding domain-containing protein [Guyanagaster necrorhizus MCA 3950]KAG7444039.1 winged helix DNA-binding domain-containing protein [Guyanagaster necrorhizus MCA 3950]
MIADPKSEQFITWTQLGTSFVVSNIGEFSRSILGSHFKHNNFSSFVRQLNMYGFHKINRTPRAQRTSTDSQTWEFSHHKFLRGRPDLLDDIKRKALEPDLGAKHRVELPGEVGILPLPRSFRLRVGIFHGICSPPRIIISSFFVPRSPHNLQACVMITAACGMPLFTSVAK